MLIKIDDIIFNTNQLKEIRILSSHDECDTDFYFLKGKTKTFNYKKGQILIKHILMNDEKKSFVEIGNRYYNKDLISQIEENPNDKYYAHTITFADETKEHITKFDRDAIARTERPKTKLVLEK
ncbi:MAG: hypothetical protein PHQ62_00195 [Clostridia bacterium]|nr:hypothetical protein [Clostridia bacterium]